MIPQSFIQDLLARVDIVDVIESAVPLKRAGSNMSACCPFHKEKSPSFTVSPTKQFYHCFGCGAHGTAISFMMEYHGLGFVEAVTDLAARVGMTVPEPEPGQARVAPVKPEGPDLTEIMQTAARYYKEQLKNSEPAIRYLKGRGLTGEIAAKFALGFAPAGWQNLEHPFENYDDKALVDAGLVIVNDEGRKYDRFRDRIMFPIVNPRGDIVGFGGRVMGQGEPKYLNSPETPIFEKGRELYGLFQARQAMRAANRAIVVEGYMDVVALAQYGVENAVATLGTATTPFHVQKLLRQVDYVTFCFDGDAAGRRAAWRALEVSLQALSDGKQVSFLFLPESDDPDSYVRAHGKDAFQKLIADAEPLSKYMLRELQSGMDMSTPEARAAFVKHAEPLLKQIVAPNLGLAMRDMVAQASGLPVDRLPMPASASSGSASRGSAPYPRNKPQTRAPIHLRRGRQALLGLVARPEAWPKIKDAIGLTAIEGDWTAVQALVRGIEVGALNPSTVTLLAHLVETGNESTAQALEQNMLELGDDHDYISEIDGLFAQLQLEARRAQSESAVAGIQSLADVRPEDRALINSGGRTELPK